MSYTSIDTCVNDKDLQARVKSAASKEAWAGGDEFKNSPYGERLRTYPDEAIATFMYATAIDYEDEYAYALDNGNEEAGKDPGVISDANIQASIQAHWPTSPPPIPTDMNGPTPGEPV
jgi:hypothetical protein